MELSLSVTYNKLEVTKTPSKIKYMNDLLFCLNG